LNQVIITITNNNKKNFVGDSFDLEKEARNTIAAMMNPIFLSRKYC
jgi:hypothetical protein